MVKDNKVIYELIEPISRLQLEAQLKSIESIEAKTGFILAGEGVILTIISGAILQGYIHTNLLIVIGLILIFCSFLVAVIILFARKFQLGLDVEKFYKDNINVSENQARVNALALVNHSLKNNRESQKSKGFLFNVTLFTFALGIMFVCIGIAYGLNFDYNTRTNYYGHPQKSGQFGRFYYRRH